MDIVEYNHFDRTHWASGPWSKEPDEIQWVDVETQLPCMILRSSLGNWCGYGGIPVTHPHFGCDYYPVNARVHGGLTYAGVGEFLHENHAPTGYWWFGFDCAHSGDLWGFNDPLTWAMHKRYPLNYVYRNVEYVMEECRQLARQLYEADHAS